MHDEDLNPELCAARLARFHNRTSWPEKILGGFAGAALILMLLVTLGGCAQNTEQPNEQTSNQDAAQQSVTVPQTNQTQQSQAPKRQFVQINVHPERIFNGDEDGYSDGDENAALAKAVAGGDGKPIDDHRTYAVTVGDISITEGGAQTPSIGGTTTGTSTGSQTASQTPSQTPTQTATQDIKPEIGISVALALAPGGVIDQMVTALGGKGSISDLDKQSQADLKTAMLEGVKSNDYGEFLALFKSLFDVPAPDAVPPGGETPQTPQE